MMSYDTFLWIMHVRRWSPRDLTFELAFSSSCCYSCPPVLLSIRIPLLIASIKRTVAGWNHNTNKHPILNAIGLSLKCFWRRKMGRRNFIISQLVRVYVLMFIKETFWQAILRFNILLSCHTIHGIKWISSEGGGTKLVFGMGMKCFRGMDLQTRRNKMTEISEKN